MFKTYEDYYQHLNQLAENHPDLLNIYQKYVDETGRPIEANYPQNMILEMIEKNQHSRRQFIEEMKVLMPYEKKKDFEVYFDIFVGGMEFLGKELKKETQKKVNKIS